MEEIIKIKSAFAPIENGESRILILGTMPGERSLKLNQYYGHKSNQFWKLIFDIFNEPSSNDYADRVALLKKIKLPYGMS